MSALSPGLDRLIREFGGPSDQTYRNLRAVIEQSPALLQQMNLAVALGHLKHFALMPEQENAGASFSPATQSINLKRSDLLDSEKRDTLTFILGHEVQHALNREQTKQGLERFDHDVRHILERGQEAHDYSQPMHRMLALNRDDEAIAHIAGWNALASRLNHSNSEAGLKDVGRLLMLVDYAGDFVHLDEVAGRMEFVVKPGFTLNADMSITPDVRNIEASGRHYFDKIPDDARLGHHGNSDYTNYYAAGLVSTVCQYEMLNPSLAGKLQLDMQGLKLQEKLLEQNGISLGRADARCTYYDAISPAIESHFDHTADSHTYIPIHGLPSPTPLAPGLNQTERTAQITEPEHPGHALFKQAQAGVHQLDAEVGRTPDHRSDQLAAALAAAAGAQGMDRIDRVALSTDASSVFAMQGGLNSPFKRLASVPTVESLDTSISQSTQAWERAFAQSQEQAQQPLAQQTQQRQEPAMRL